MRTIDLFAGIGGIRLGFENAFGDDLETVFASECDEKAQETYRANFSDTFAINDDLAAVALSSIPEFDICSASFPYQIFGRAAKHPKKNNCAHNQGMPFFDVARVCAYHKPKVIFCVSSKRLSTQNEGTTLGLVTSTLTGLGYRVYTEVLDSRNFGVPQHRNCTYIVAFRADVAPNEFSFPLATGTPKRLKDIIEEEAVPAKYYIGKVALDGIKKHKITERAKGNSFGYKIRDLDDIAAPICRGAAGHYYNLIVDRRQKDLTPTTYVKGGKINRQGIRKLTPREWARLQGFPDSFKLPGFDKYLYKQLADSVTVPVVEAIASKIKDVLE